MPVGETVVSPPAHRRSTTPIGLLEFVTQLRELSGGKPVGFKLCVGRRHEFLAICKAMVETGITPDFITVDGGEGGTGAAPLEFSDHVGMPMRDAVHFVNNALRGVGLRDRIRVLASGEDRPPASTWSEPSPRRRRLQLGPRDDARARVHPEPALPRQHLPDRRRHPGPGRARGLVVEDKAQRVAAYHEETIEAFLELFASMGCTDPSEIDPGHLMRRLDESTITTYAQLYPALPIGSLLEPGDAAPPVWRDAWAAVRADSFA